MTNDKRINIHYEIIGEGEPLVLLMGLGAHGQKWKPHSDAYKKHYRCILIDNRGAGQSDKPEMDSYTTEIMADDTISVLDKLKIEKAHFHGISMGGAICQIIAAKHPERVRSIILTSTFAKTDNYFIRALEILRDSVGILDGKTFSRLCQYMIYSSQYHRSNLQDMLDAERKDEEDPFPMPAYAYRAQCNACIAHNALPLLEQISAPVLVAAGDSDLFVSMDATMQLVNGIKNAELYLCKGGGHVHHFERPDEFNKVTLDFLMKH